MNQPKSTLAKATLACTLAGLFLAAAGSALAQTDTFEFTANRGQPKDLNGSTITLSDPSDPTIVSWNIDINGSHYTDGYVLSDDITSFNSDGFQGSFTLQDGSFFGGTGAFGTDNDGDPTLFNPGGGSLIVYIDPLGSWDLVDVNGNGGQGDPVPDSAGTLALLAGALTTMAGLRVRLLRR